MPLRAMSPETINDQTLLSASRAQGAAGGDQPLAGRERPGMPEGGRCRAEPNRRRPLAADSRQAGVPAVGRADGPRCAASDRVDQCVASLGALSKVVVTIRSTCSSVTVRGRPGRGSSSSPSKRCSAKRVRHLVTVGRDTRSRSAISKFDRPSAASSTIRERNASACAVFPRRDQASSRPRSSSVSSITRAMSARGG